MFSKLAIDLPGANSPTCIWSAGRNRGGSHVIRMSSDCVTDAKTIGPLAWVLVPIPREVGFDVPAENPGKSDGLNKGGERKQ